MKKIVSIILVSLILLIMISMVNADSQTAINNTTNLSINSTHDSSSVNIVCNSSPWIDPVSDNKDKRSATINYTITGISNGTIVPIITNHNSSYKLTPINITNETGSFRWDGDVDGNRINQAGNPYNITLVLMDANEIEISRSSPNKIFIGRPVVILHGLFQVADSMKDTKLSKELSKSYTVQSTEYLTNEYQSGPESALGDIRDYGSQLSSEIRKIKQTTGAEKVDIIGYSMGGLVARWYYQELGGSNSTGKLIMLGTPNYGTELSNCIFTDFNDNTGVAIIQMRPHSSFIKKLNGNNKCSFKESSVSNKFNSKGYITMASKDYKTVDHVHLSIFTVPWYTDGDSVISYNSARLPNVYNQDVHGSHLYLPDNAGVVNGIISMLKTADNQYYYDQSSLN